MTQDNGASVPDQALVNHAPAGHGPSGFDPSRITAALEAVDGKLLEPIIRKAADEFYCTAMEAAQDYLQDNLDHNLKSHLSMLEYENQRMRTELYEVDKALGGLPLGHGNRVEAIETNDRNATLYMELLWQVSKKHEGETRHETALRYLRDSDGRPQGGDGEARLHAKRDSAAIAQPSSAITQGEPS